MTPAARHEINMLIVAGSSVRLLWRQITEQSSRSWSSSEPNQSRWLIRSHKLCRIIETGCFINIIICRRTFSDSAVYGIMTFRMSWMSWPTFFPTWPRLKTKECGAEPNVSSATWLAVARDFFWFLLWKASPQVGKRKGKKRHEQTNAWPATQQL